MSTLENSGLNFTWRYRDRVNHSTKGSTLASIYRPEADLEGHIVETTQANERRKGERRGRGDRILSIPAKIFKDFQILSRQFSGNV
jgi:hypothetical protein